MTTSTPRTTAPDPVADLRRMSHEELVRLGEASLREHVLAQAVVAHCRYGPHLADQLDRFLNDPECVRHPTRVVFEFGEMGVHQFAQPDLDWRNTGQDGRVLYVRPALRGRPDQVLRAVAYLIPVINYGSMATDELCVAYGAALLGLTEDEYYRQLCLLAGEVGAEARWPESGSCPAEH